MVYENKQIGWLVIIISLVIMMSLNIFYVFNIGTDPITIELLLVLMLVFVLVLLFFYKLTIRVDHLGIHVIYGIGLVHIKILPERINRIKILKTPWYSGYGIRVTEKGMLYNIQGRNAIEISYFKGTNKTVQIGSNDALNLKRFLEQAYRV